MLVMCFGGWLERSSGALGVLDLTWSLLGLGLILFGVVGSFLDLGLLMF